MSSPTLDRFTYLILINQISILRDLFEMCIPTVVRDEMFHPDAPQQVRSGIGNPPFWIEIVSQAATEPTDPLLSALDEGERAAIALATVL